VKKRVPKSVLGRDIGIEEEAEKELRFGRDVFIKDYS